MGIRQLLAKGIGFLHLGAIVFLLSGWLLPIEWLWLHLMAVPAVIVQWWMNQNQCVLTQWQHRLQGHRPSEAEGAFVRDLFAKLGLKPSDRQLFLIIYGALAFSWALSLALVWTFHGA